MTTCQCREPQECPAWGRFVVWADIHSCQSNGPPGRSQGPSRPIGLDRSGACRFKGGPLLDEYGFQRVRPTGCGCNGSASKTRLFECDHPHYALTAEERCEERCGAYQTK